MSSAREAVAAAGGWRTWFSAAHELPPAATKAEKADRGREFEGALIEMFNEDGLEPRANYRPTGEEVDGSIWLDGRTYLFEAKWTSAAHPASSLYQFKGKVDGKLTGTIGLFFSMSGYSTDAVDALIAGKDLNLVLFDRADVDLVIENRVGIAEAIRLKLRAAAESGTPYAQLGSLLTAGYAREAVGRRPTIVFVEGPVDRQAFHILRKARNATEPVELIVTSGPSNMAPMIDAVLNASSEPIPFVAILEDDEAGVRVGRDVQELVDRVNAEGGRAELLWIPGSLEASLGLVDAEGRPTRHVSQARLWKHLMEVDLDKQVTLHPELGPVLRAAGIPMSKHD